MTIGSEKNFNVFLSDAHLKIVCINVKSATNPLLSVKLGTPFLLKDIVYGMFVCSKSAAVPLVFHTRLFFFSSIASFDQQNSIHNITWEDSKSGKDYGLDSTLFLTL